jgi:hypothetical protein
MHRDPFAPILPVLENDEPLRLYKQIADEILLRFPDERKLPFQAAIASRSYMLLRLAMQLGIRQRNLRELLVCRPEGQPTSAHELANLGRGELRWTKASETWEVFIPSAAFKNASSSFFHGRPYSLVLSDTDNFYAHISKYIVVHRPMLLGKVPDPGTFFVRSGMSSLRVASYDMFSFYAAWKSTIQRYGIFNPYTGRGAIKGLLPHGPHCIRDVIATHIIKTTGSFELASFALQDTVDTVVRHYARFLPHEKAERAARVLNQVWQ